MVVNRYDNGVPKGPLTINTSSTNAKELLTAIKETILYLKTNRNLPEDMKVNQNANVKVMATPKRGMFDFFSKNEPVDLLTLSEDELTKLSLEPTIDVYLSTPTGGKRSRKSRKSRKRR